MKPHLQFQPFLLVRGLTKSFFQGQWPHRQRHRVLDGVNLSLHCGQTLAIVGESGCGKTTLAMCLAGLERCDSGQIWVDGCNLAIAGDWQREKARTEVQIVFQDSAGALNPLMTALEIVEEPLRVQCVMRPRQREKRAVELMLQSGLAPEMRSRRPDQMSGGQRQRLALARALALRPRLLILDEPFRGLDLSSRAEIINLLIQLQVTNNLGYLYISHELDVVRHFADEVAVMHAGRIVEWGLTLQVLTKPIHPSARTLIAASDAMECARQEAPTCATS